MCRWIDVTVAAVERGQLLEKKRALHPLFWDSTADQTLSTAEVLPCYVLDRDQV